MPESKPNSKNSINQIVEASSEVSKELLKEKEIELEKILTFLDIRLKALNPEHVKIDKETFLKRIEKIFNDHTVESYEELKNIRRRSFLRGLGLSGLSASIGGLLGYSTGEVLKLVDESIFSESQRLFANKLSEFFAVTGAGLGVFAILAIVQQDYAREIESLKNKEYFSLENRSNDLAEINNILISNNISSEEVTVLVKEILFLREQIKSGK